MTIKAFESEDGLVVALDGEIDHHAAKEVRESLDRMITQMRPKVLCLELSGINFMDSSGLGLVLGRYRRISESGGRMLLRNPSARTEKLLRMAGVDKLMRIEKKEENA